MTNSSPNKGKCIQYADNIFRKCRDVKHISESTEYLNNDPRIRGVPGQLKLALQTADEMITKLRQHVGALSEKESKFLEEIDDYTTRLLAKIEELKNYATTKVTTKHQQLASEATRRIKVIANVKKDITKCLEDAVKSDGRTAHLFILHKKGQTLVRNVEKLCSDSEDLMKTNLVFKPDLRIEECMDDFKSLGLAAYEASSQDSITLSVARGAESCNVEACCPLPDGTILLLDNKNKRLKHVDPFTGGVKDLCDLYGNLWGISLISQHEVAVCTGSSLEMVSLVDKKTRKKKLIQKNRCFRVVHNSEELCISDSRCVYVSDLTGRLLRTICKDTSGEDMFSSIRGMTMNQTGDRLYVADVNKGLVCTDRDGQEIFRLSVEDLGLSKALGVCTDQRGNVLVIGYQSNNVVQVTEEGQVVGEILSQADGIERPKYMCFDEDSRRLYVGGETSKLMMYTLV